VEFKLGCKQQNTNDTQAVVVIYRVRDEMKSCLTTFLWYGRCKMDGTWMVWYGASLHFLVSSYSYTLMSYTNM